MYPFPSRAPKRRPPIRLPGLLAATLLSGLAVLATGCSQAETALQGPRGSMIENAGPAGAPMEAPGDAASLGDGSSAAPAEGQPKVEYAERKLVFTGDMSLQVKDVAAAM